MELDKRIAIYIGRRYRMYGRYKCLLFKICPVQKKQSKQPVSRVGITSKINLQLNQTPGFSGDADLGKIVKPFFMENPQAVQPASEEKSKSNAHAEAAYKAFIQQVVKQSGGLLSESEHGKIFSFETYLREGASRQKIFRSIVII